MLEPCLFWAGTSVLFKRVANEGIYMQLLEPRELPWQIAPQESFFMNISGLKFEDYCSNISRHILDSIYYHVSCTVHYIITFLICIIQKHLISLEWKKIVQKEKHYSSVFWRALQISSNYFSFHRHFKCLINIEQAQCLSHLVAE